MVLVINEVQKEAISKLGLLLRLKKLICHGQHLVVLLLHKTN